MTTDPTDYSDEWDDLSEHDIEYHHQPDWLTELELTHQRAVLEKSVQALGWEHLGTGRAAEALCDTLASQELFQELKPITDKLIELYDARLPPEDDRRIHAHYLNALSDYFEGDKDKALERIKTIRADGINAGAHEFVMVDIDRFLRWVEGEG